jgi:spore coat polysaccharide biosynthesis protein SpsF (cytidylyltransferase family)/aryl-alcohol dehydrogenase-like predicted oxidoreductase
MATGAAEPKEPDRRQRQLSHTRVVVQARLSSSRFPGKALLPLGGMPLAELVARRAGRSGYDVVVATSDEPDDDPLARSLTGAGVRVIRGPLDDVLARFVAATFDLDPADVVVRITADNPFVDADLLAELLEAFDRSGGAYARIEIERVPHGLGAEVFTVEALRRAAAQATSRPDREHVTPWLRREEGETAIVPAATPSDFRGLRCTVDVLHDYERVFAVFDESDDPVGTPWPMLVAALQRHPGFTSGGLPVRDTSELGQATLVLGTAQVGMDYGIANTSGRPDDSRVRRILRAAVDSGVTHLDTARAYGDSEATLRRCLEPALAQRLAVVTKVAPVDWPTSTDRRLAALAVEASVERSFAELGRRRVDALLLHRAGDALVGGGAAWRRLLDYRREGAVGRIGVSVQSPRELRMALGLEELGYVQLPFNVLDRRWFGPEGLDWAQLSEGASDVVVSVRSVYLQGLLTGTNPPRNEIGIDVMQVRAALSGLAEELGRESIADLCMAYVLGQPWATSVVVGAETEDQVRNNARLATLQPLSAEQCRMVRETLPGGPENVIDPSRWAPA